MTYDVPLRYQQALDTSALTTIRATLHAMEAAVLDCRRAGISPDTDAAVVLLARHLGGVSTNVEPDAVLRAACARRLEELGRFPALLALAISGVAFDAEAKKRFHADGRRAMRRLAEVLAPGGDASLASSAGERAGSDCGHTH